MHRLTDLTVEHSRLSGWAACRVSARDADDAVHDARVHKYVLTHSNPGTIDVATARSPCNAMVVYNLERSR